MRIYFKLLRLPYQLQLGPIFAWGFLLGGGSFASSAETLRFVVVFLIFHIGAFGGMTALNSFYDRDETPVGGMWAPPKIPPKLGLFAWLIQLGGLVLLLPLGWKLSLIYAALLVLSWLYSHPKPRGKGHPWKSLAIVSVGQGVLDCLAGAFATSTFATSELVTSELVTSDLALSSTGFAGAFWFGCVGATLTVAAFFPLTQLYQAAEDAQNGDKTLALWLLKRGGRSAVFGWSSVLCALGTLGNAGALWKMGWPRDAIALLVAGTVPLIFIAQWKRKVRTSEMRTDFERVHFLMRAMAWAFGGYVLWKLSVR